VTSVGEIEEKANTIQSPLLVFFSPSALFYARVYLFKESTPYFLLVKLRVFSIESEHLLFPEGVLFTKETLDVHGDVRNDVPTY